MDPQIAPSFIPKEALAQERVRAGGMGIFFLISLIVFVLALAAAGGAFLYQRYVASKLVDDKATLATEEGAFDPKTIEDLKRMDTRLTEAKVLLGKHVAPSGIFDFLAQNTLPNVQFTSFNYALADDGTASVELNGTTDTFATMALQSDALGKSAALRDVIFSNITVETGGSVSFTLHAVVDPSLIAYAKIEAAQAAQAQPPAQQ